MFTWRVRPSSFFFSSFNLRVIFYLASETIFSEIQPCVKCASLSLELAQSCIHIPGGTSRGVQQRLVPQVASNNVNSVADVNNVTMSQFQQCQQCHNVNNVTTSQFQQCQQCQQCHQCHNVSPTKRAQVDEHHVLKYASSLLREWLDHQMESNGGAQFCTGGD